LNANNLPLRGFKFDVLEGGVRVPMIIRWPGQNLKGKVYRKMVSSFDLFPTLLQAAGLEMPENQHTDGVDLLPYIIGENKSAPHEWLCWQNRTRRVREPAISVSPNTRQKEHDCAIRKGKWKLVREAELIDSDNPPPWQLFDLSKDIGEKNNLANAHPEIVGELDKLLAILHASELRTLKIKIPLTYANTKHPHQNSGSDVTMHRRNRLNGISSQERIH